MFNKGNKIRSSSRRDKIIISISILLIVISLIVIGATFFLNSKPLSDDSNPLASGIGTPDSIKSKVLNILVVGIDEDFDRGTTLTDVIMLVSFNIQDNQVKILQIPRDTFVGTSLVYTGKINGIYSAGNTKKGIAGLSDAIHNMFDLNIDYYVTMTMDGFRKIIDKIGGVEVDVPQAFNLEGVYIKKGIQVLNGVQAEKFVRVRSIYNDGDIGRVLAQRTFLSALAKKFINAGINNLISLIPEMSSSVKSDMSVINMIDVAKLGSKLSLDGISVYLLPGEAFMNKDQSVYTLHKQETADLLNSHFRPFSEPVPASKLNITELSKTTNAYDSKSQNFNDIGNSSSSSVSN